MTRAMMSDATTSRSPQAFDPILLYDGTCGVCARSVQFVLRHEGRVRTLRFASLQGPYGSDVRARHPELEAVDSIIWYAPVYDGRAERVLVRTDAVVQVLAYLGGGWRVLGALIHIVPRVVRDGVYDLVARHRHRLASNDVCVVPTAEQRVRFPEMQ
ncbi:MAG TPA: DCC1-like thiol-disulfide oxidoreductase family protein [Gemmatimonadaceae bacterium]|nr:DCC1-like thiol-disulfide oxidoreductase family protein [Gemmatimonadaceae bacterium]